MASNKGLLVASLLLFLFSSSCILRGSSNPDLNGLLQNLSHGSVASLHNTMQCMEKLLPCKPYLNDSTTNPPPDTCCSPLRDLVSEDFPCVCSFFNDPQILPALNVSRNDALQLPKACSVRIRLRKCSEASAPSPTPSGIGKGIGIGAGTGTGLGIGAGIGTGTGTDSAAIQSTAAAALAAAQKSLANATASQEAPATSSGSTKRITYFGVLVAFAAMFINSLLFSA